MGLRYWRIFLNPLFPSTVRTEIIENLARELELPLLVKSIVFLFFFLVSSED